MPPAHSLFLSEVGQRVGEWFGVGGGVGGAPGSSGASGVDFVAEGVGEGFGGVVVGDGVAGAVQEAVELAEGEGVAGAAQQGEADGAEFSAGDPFGGVVGGWERFVVVDSSAASTSGADAAGAEFVVRGADVGEKGLAFGREVDELLVELVDAGADGVFVGEEAFVAGVDVTAGAGS
jgi:hypothetical protein